MINHPLNITKTSPPVIPETNTPVAPETNALVIPEFLYRESSNKYCNAEPLLSAAAIHRSPIKDLGDDVLYL